MLQQAAKIVENHIRDQFDAVGVAPENFEVYVIWFAKTSQNWKVLLSTTLDDGMYYEVMHDGVTDAPISMHTRSKQANVIIPDKVS